MSPAQYTQQQLPWHQAAWELFAKWQHSNKIPHAILLTGVAGLGLQTFAQQLAQLLLCQSPLEQVACGQCAACQMFQTGVHPDYFPLITSAEEKSLKVDMIRQLSTQLVSTAQQGGRKVALLYRAEQMNAAAANALLKTLEEPVKDTIIILVSYQTDALLATIRSRCQSISFNLPSQPVAQQWLAEQAANLPDYALAVAEGSPEEALAFADEKLQQAYEVGLSALSEFKDPIVISGALAVVSAEQALIWLQQFYQDLLRAGLGLTQQLTHQHYVAQICALSKQMSTQQCSDGLISIQNLVKILRKQPNLNLQLQLDSLMIELFQRHAQHN